MNYKAALLHVHVHATSVIYMYMYTHFHGSTFDFQVSGSFDKICDDHENYMYM